MPCIVNTIEIEENKRKLLKCIWIVIVFHVFIEIFQLHEAAHSKYLIRLWIQNTDVYKLQMYYICYIP